MQVNTLNLKKIIPISSITSTEEYIYKLIDSILYKFNSCFNRKMVCRQDNLMKYPYNIMYPDDVIAKRNNPMLHFKINVKTNIINQFRLIHLWGDNN